MNKTKKQQILDQALHTIEFEGLSKDEKKAINAYNNAMKAGLALMQGEALRPTTQIEGSGMESLMKELIEEDQKKLMESFKDGFRGLLKDKITLDNVFKQKRTEFNKLVVQEKKAFTVKVNKVLSIVKDMDKLRADYMSTLTTIAVDPHEAPDEEQ